MQLQRTLKMALFQNKNNNFIQQFFSPRHHFESITAYVMLWSACAWCCWCRTNKCLHQLCVCNLTTSCPIFYDHMSSSSSHVLVEISKFPIIGLVLLSTALIYKMHAYLHCFDYTLLPWCNWSIIYNAWMLLVKLLFSHYLRQVWIQ